MKMPLLTSTQKIMSFTVPGPISEVSELSWFLHTVISEIPTATSKLHLLEYSPVSGQHKQQAV